ncbi:hypothetical protein ACFQ2M_06675 [Kitasatospora saccharophila]|uniref:hypothetical protein n=1 Tax=Kitasatospora saccharophila TaxID=407973 RepID=UPI003624B4EF
MDHTQGVETCRELREQVRRLTADWRSTGRYTPAATPGCARSTWSSPRNSPPAG